MIMIIINSQIWRKNSIPSDAFPNNHQSNFHRITNILRSLYIVPSELILHFCTSSLGEVSCSLGELTQLDWYSAQNLHLTSYFKIISRPQYWTKISETGTKTSVISLANHSIKNHLIPSYREKVITVLMEPCPRTRNQISSRILPNFNWVFWVRF
jgi:hypothetical protein